MSVADARAELTELRSERAAASLDRRLGQLPDGHPSSPRYADAVRDPERTRVEHREADRVRPLTDAEHADHVADVRRRLADARAAGLETDATHTIDAGREVWTDERDAAHQEIVDTLYGQSAQVPCEGKAILAGGLPGAGKTTVLREHAGIDLSQYLMINPDEIKEEMARRGLIPDVPGLSPMEASDLVHEESSLIAKRLANRAENDHKNVIWDITMSRTSSISDRVSSLRSAAFTRIDGIFVDVPLEASVARADARHRTDHDRYQDGQGFGGRCIPEGTIRSNANSEWGSSNRKNFEELKGQFDVWFRYDNSVDGRPPVLLDSSAPGRPESKDLD
ncbi:MAG: zeta toxin family protein [Streptosporangiaceae bacterium]